MQEVDLYQLLYIPIEIETVVDSESMMYSANNSHIVNYSTFIILMNIIKIPGMFVSYVLQRHRSPI